MTMAESAFTLTYWGATGSLTAPLRPAEVTDKIVQAIQFLAANGSLARLCSAGVTQQAVRECLDSCPYYLRSSYGGNTSCFEIQAGENLIIVDSGSGFRELGISLNRRWNSPDYRGNRAAHVFFTHAHMDHTFGTAFFDPYYDPRNHFTFWASTTVKRSLDTVLSPTSDFSGVYFPPTYELMRGIKEFRDVKADMVYQLGDTRITTFALNHPGTCIGYRFDRLGKSIVLASDHEHKQTPDPTLVDFARGADLLYADAQYLEDEYEGRVGIMKERPVPRRGWGHSSVESFIASAVAADAKRLHLGHREPKRDDADLHRVERFAQEAMRQTLIAQGRDPNEIEVCIVREDVVVEL